MREGGKLVIGKRGERVLKGAVVGGRIERVFLDREFGKRGGVENC